MEFESIVAVRVRNVEKRYTRGPGVLNGLSMTVPSNQIYALLGSSGCGKSTLLSCILGLQSFQHGSILVFGAVPGTEESRLIGIPGRNIGYMSQVVGLHLGLTVGEILKYFGIVSGMENSEIENANKELGKTLQLPEGSRKLEDLSGGGLRIVSLFLALQHHPRLIVLDEPTVGVDPILRHGIWEHLQHLVRNQRATVIVTTHYLDEARKADIVGVMRDGGMIAESPPQRLLQLYNAPTLEEAVLNLYKSQAALNSNSASSTTDKISSHQTLSINKSCSRIQAMIWIDFLLFSRNTLHTLFVTLIPTIFLSVVCLTFGLDPEGVSIGYVNMEETTNCSTNSSSLNSCELTTLSCRFIQSLESTTSLRLKRCINEVEAIDQVQAGNLHGYLVFQRNFSEALQNYFVDRIHADNLNRSTIVSRLDESNKIISLSLKVKLIEGFVNFASNLLTACGLDSEVIKSPLQYKKPLVGRENLDLNQYNAIGFCLAAIFFFPIISAGTRLVHERNSGMLERSLISGAQSWEMFASFFASQTFIIAVQILLAYCTVLFIFKIPNEGDFLFVLLLLFLSGWSGLSFGLVLGSFCSEEIQIAIIAIAFLFPNTILGGIIYPLEGMPYILQKIARFLPCTLASESLRSIFFRGWGIGHPNVWPGFAVLVGYCVGVNCCILFYFKYLKKFVIIS